MSGPLTGWRVLLRLAWRDVLRNKGRSALILVMIALPVFGVTAAHVVISTEDVNSVESLDRRIGTADAGLNLERGTSEVFQEADPERGQSGTGEGSNRELATPEDIVRVLGADATLVPYRTDWLHSRFGDRLVSVEVTSADLTKPVFNGTWELMTGRIPEKTGEIMVNAKLADRGVEIGDRIEFHGNEAPVEIVGTAEDASYRGQPKAWAFPGSIAVDPRQQPDDYLVEVAGGVGWEQVRELNEIGVAVLSRAVVNDPPSRDELHEVLRMDGGFSDDEMIFATAVLVVTMALLEVILLAGPAFAVGARRMHRNLAQVAATGGTPGQVRRAVLATAVVLGGIAGAVGVIGGIVAGAIGAPIAQGFSSSQFGPFDVVWTQILGIGLLGWLSAVLAALVPAWIASKQDVVRVLAGRRGDSAPSRLSPLLGGALFAAGVAIAIHGTRQHTWGEVWIALAAVLVVMGGVLLLSPVVALVGRLAARAPLPLRYAARDASRHRTRTIPAIGAVMATVTGVVALGIANASDAEQSRATYEPAASEGSGFVTFWPDGIVPEVRAEGWTKVIETTRDAVPGAEVLETFTVGGDVDGMTGEVGVKETEDRPGLLSSYGGYFGNWIVADQKPAVDLWVQDGREREINTALAAGKVVLFTDPRATWMARETDHPAPDLARDSVTLQVQHIDEWGTGKPGREVTVPAVVLPVERGTTQGIVPTAVAERLGTAVDPSAIAIPGPVSSAEEKALEKALTAAGVAGADVYVERGYRESKEDAVLLLVLALAGGLLMVCGTLTATFLALSDAGPDLATLSAVGAAPRERRLVAASYALVVGGVGAVLGAVVGLVPGVAASWPMTGNSWESQFGGPSHYLDIPWLLILGVVVGLPLLTALVVGLCARSRLPLVARID